MSKVHENRLAKALDSKYRALEDEVGLRLSDGVEQCEFCYRRSFSENAAIMALLRHARKYNFRQSWFSYARRYFRLDRKRQVRQEFPRRRENADEIEHDIC